MNVLERSYLETLLRYLKESEASDEVKITLTISKLESFLKYTDEDESGPL